MTASKKQFIVVSGAYDLPNAETLAKKPARPSAYDMHTFAIAVKTETDQSKKLYAINKKLSGKREVLQRDTAQAKDVTSSNR